MLYWTVKMIGWLVCLLPSSWALRIGYGLGTLCWPFVPRRRKQMAEDNIMRSLEVDRPTAQRIARRSGVRFGPLFMEVLRLPLLNRENIRRFVRFEGEQHLWEALQHGRGVVLATAHSGNWEMLGAALAMYDFPIIGIAQRQTNRDMNRLINEYRTGTGMPIVYKQGVRDMVKLLGEGKIVGLLMDQDNLGDGVFVEFFGRLASTPQGAAALARLKGSPIVPVFISSQGDGTHLATAHPAVWLEKTPDRERDIFVTTQQLTRIVEQHIRDHPAEWFWLHNRWKTPPPESVGVKTDES
ncbi:MAG TPA: lysophospholipid acyltransferase family protein [Patescibacteria group bacterium]|nr:lysophospholipid acyltransferase family protein [Patescibacteria group bacterium]